MVRDIRVPVLLSAEEYMALTHMAEEDGDSQSGLLRRLMRMEARRRASSMADEIGSDSAVSAQVLTKGAA